MEDQKKNATPAAQGNNHHGKRQPRKHKSYFITPNAPAESGEQTRPVQAPHQSQAQGTASPQNDGHTKAKHKNHHNRNKKPSGDNNAQSNTERTAPVVAETKNTAVQNQPKHNKNKNNQRRHGDRPKEAQNAPDNASTAKDTLSDVLMPSSATSKRSDRLERPAPKKLDKFSESSDFEKYADYEEFTYAELYGKLDENSVSDDEITDPDNKADNDTDSEDTKIEPMVEVVGIRFKASGKTYYFDPKSITLKAGTHAIVDTARGLEYGEVALGNTMVKESETVPPLRPVVRMATEADIKHHADNKRKEDDAFRLCNERIICHGLDMKLIDAQYTFDNSKLLFYFTSSGRVDFRDLVKDLAGIFRTRIELRQIGIRDEAKMIGGLGPCGRPLCCSIFLTDFGQVSIKMAKEQNLSLNSSKISGICGRLMCCLRYEHESYEYEIKRTPPVDTLVRTVDGVGVITEISPLAGTVKVRLNDSSETPPKSYKREEISILKKKK